MKKYFEIVMAFLLFPSVVFSQTAAISGKIQDNERGVNGASIKISNTDFAATTDSTGNFFIANVPFGNYRIEISADHYLSHVKEVTVDKAEIILGNIILEQEDAKTSLQDIPTVELSESELSESTSDNVASVLNASRDAFNAAATYTFSIARFRTRGYEDENFITYMNGSPMADLTSGRTLYNSWSGLNDVMRSRESTTGLNASNYAFGAIGGSFAIDSRASRQRKQLQASFALSNRTYDNRFMLTYGTGVLKNGWSFALSGTRRWAGEGYVKGTFYDGWSYFGSAEKILNSKHSLAFTLFASPLKNGRSTPAVQEMYDLAGTNYYNPNWGYQSGEKRNARVGRNNQPIAIVTHDFKIDSKSSLLSSISFVTGTSKISGLDWLNAADPRADYYRNLPSYYYSQGFTAVGDALTQVLSTDENARQLNWDLLYQRNYLAKDTANYIIEDRVTKNNIISLNSVYNRTVNDQLSISAGITYTKQKSEYYKEVNDLLGAEYYININKFALQDFPSNPDAYQNDLNNPNRIVKVGDRFGYDYVANISRPSGWLQGIYKLEKVDFFGAVELASVSFYRDGKYKNGLFPDGSYGKSETQSFFNYALKGGLTYKLNGRNYLLVNGSVLTRAPYFENAFVSARTRNQVAPELENENVSSIEGGYLLRAPKLKVKAIGYYTKFKNSTSTVSYFSEDNQAYVNFTQTKINKTHTGVELGADANLGNGFSATAAAAVGQYYYSSRPLAFITQDNLATIIASDDTVFSKNLRVAGSPQTATTVGFSYRSKNFWFVNLNFNYFSNMYIDYFPGRRTRDAIDLIEEDSELWNTVLGQEKLDGQFTVDFFGSWSWKLNNKFKGLKRNTFFVVNAGVNNILNNKKFITGGYEYSRFNSTDDLDVFTSKYNYAYGTTFFINLALRMN